MPSRRRCAGGKDDVRRIGIEHILRGHWAGGIEVNIFDLFNLCQTPINDAPPFDEIGKFELEQDTTTRLTLRVGENDLVPALTQRPRAASGPGRSCTDDENVIVRFSAQ